MQEKKVREAFNSFTDSSVNFRFMRDGRTRHGHTEWKFEFDKNGKPLRIFGILQDITKRVLLAKEVIKEEIKKKQELIDAVIAAQERERSFLGEELHDNINQILSTSKLYMEMVLTGECLQKDLITDSKNYIISAMEEIRKLSKSLLPPSLGETSLADALSEMTGDIQRVNKLHFIKEWKGINESLLSEKLSLAIFRIAQEQLNNILKHANAKTVIIGLKQEAGMLQLRIKDDGAGFDTSRKRNGIGLKNIISRADLLNGEVTIASRPGEGCELLVNFNTGVEEKD